MALIAVSAIYVGGCATPSPIHIKKDNFASCQAVSPKTAETHYAVLKWYAEVYQHEDKNAKSKAAAKEGLIKAENMVRRNWEKQLTGQYAFLMAGKNGLQVANPGAARPEQVRGALDAVNKGILLKPKQKEAEGYYWISGLAYDDSFKAWLRDTRLYLPTTSGKNAQVRAALKTALEGHAKTATADIKKLVAAKRYKQAYEQAAGKMILYRETGGEALIQKARREIAPLLLKAEIKRVRALGFTSPKTNAGTKKLLYQARSTWQLDAVLRDSFKLPAVKKDFEQLQTDIGKGQAEFWQTQMQTMANRKKHWSLFLFQQAKLAEAAKLEKPVKLAATTGLWIKYSALLPSSLTHFLETADSEIQKGERHGSALILFGMVNEINAFLSSSKVKPSAAAGKLLKDSRRREVRSQKFVKLYVTRKLFIKDIMPKGGLGTELKGELEAAFTQLFKTTSMVYGVQMGDDNVKTTAKDYVLGKGIYATLDADYGPGNETRKTVTLKGEVVEKDNPEYIRLVRKKKKTEGVVPKLYEQTYYKYTITTKTKEAVATARLSFALFYGGEKASHQVNLKQSLRRTFVHESIDPDRTKKYTEALPGKPKSMGVREPKPTLRTERVMTKLEMKEWARGETRKIAMMQLLATLAEYPLEIAGKATEFTKEDNWQMAANSYGICMDYCRNIQPEKAEKSSYFFIKEPPAYLKPEYDRNGKVAKQLAALKKSLWKKSLDALVKYIEAD